MPESLGTTQKKKFFVHSSKMSYAGVVGHDSTEEVLKNVTRISFIFRDHNFNSHLQNYVSRLQSNCKNVPEMADIQDSSGRLVRRICRSRGARLKRRSFEM